jgi:UDP-glucose 4-epimerase
VKRVLVTGGNGFIGSHLIKKLLPNKPDSVILVSDTPHIKDRFLENIKFTHGVPITFYTADIRDGQTISNIFRGEGVDTCIHLAAKISVAESIQNPAETMDINEKGTINVLDACYNSGVKSFVFASSASVYGDVRELPISERQPLNPLAPYGTSKMLAEQHVISYSKLKKIQNAVILRIFNVYGTGQSSESDVITRFTSRLSRGLPPIIYGDGMHTRDFISVDDVVESMLLSIRLMEDRKKNSKSDWSPSIVFNIGTGIPTTIKELAEKMIQIFGYNLHPIYEKTEEDKKVILNSYADVTKAKEILHFVPKTAIDIGLREIIEPMLLRK